MPGGLLAGTGPWQRTFLTCHRGGPGADHPATCRARVMPSGLGGRADRRECARLRNPGL